MNETSWMRLAAALGVVAVLLGAAGAHGSLHEFLIQRDVLSIWQVALFYHFMHTLALLFLSGDKRTPRAVLWLFFAGIVLFSGSLYLLCLLSVPWLGPVTPVGGLCLLAGWIWLMLRAKQNQA